MKKAIKSRAFVVALLAGTALPAVAGDVLTSATTVRHPILDVDTTGSVTSGDTFLRLASSEAERSTGILVQAFKRIGADARQLRFDGEMSVSDLPVYIRPDQQADGARLRVRYLSSVLVMPEASYMEVFVNDKQVATIVLDAASEYSQAEIDIAPGLLQVGYNSVRFAVQQRHRVDCSIEAANELWTQVDPAGTGLLLSSTNAPYSTVDDLVGFPEGEDGATTITVTLPPGTSLESIDTALRAAQALAIRADVQKPRIIIAREVTNTPGIHIYAGLRKTLQGFGLDRLTLGDGEITVSGRNSMLARIALTGDTTEALDATIERLASTSTVERRATAAGARALSNQRGVVMGPDTEIDLSEFGVPVTEFSGRLFRTSFNIVTPHDFYPADTGKAVLYLDAEYVGGLLTSNEALVRVNGKVVGATRLSRGSGENVQRRAIEISLRSLHPGYNQVTLEIRAATEQDRDCNPLSLIEDRRRLTLQPTTSLSIPRFARVEFTPNLGGNSSTAFPFAAKGELALFMPKADTASLGAAATLISRWAVAARKPIRIRTMLKLPDDKTGSALIVGSAGDLPDQIYRHFNIRDDMLPQSWRQAAVRRNTSQSSGNAGPDGKPVQTAALTIRTVSDAAPASKLDGKIDGKTPSTAASAPAPEQHWIDRTLGTTSGFLQRNIGYSAEQLSFLNRGRSSTVAPESATLLMAQGKALGGGANSWFLLAGREPEELQRDTSELVSPSSWRQLHGRMVAYDPTAKGLTVFQVIDDDYVRLEDRSITNLTLFAAGWLSNHIQYYVLVLLSICLIFGIFSRKLLNRVGQQP